MRAAPPLALSLLLSLAVLSGAAEDAQDPPAAPPKLELKAPAKAPDVPEEKPVKVSEDLAKRIKELGFNFDKTGQLVHPETGTTISKQMLESAGLTLDEEGRLVYKDQPKMEVEQRHLQGVLSSLLKFGKVAAHDPRAAGRTLQAWGIPPAYDGIHLLNPDGTATYFGLMLYEGLRKDPTRVKQLSGERLSKALSLFEAGHGAAFGENLPEAGMADIGRAWNLLNWDTMRPGETPLSLKPYSDLGDSIGAYKDLIVGEDRAVLAGGPAPAGFNKKDSAAALEALNKLQRYQYHKNFTLQPGAVPTPEEKEAEPQLVAAGPMERPVEPTPPEAGMLPKLLGIVERLHGSPMSLAQQEAFVKSFPLGESVWQMGAPQLWRQGITGKGVKIAVIDTGVDFHDHLGDAVKDRKNFSRDRGEKSTGQHATHVAGTIHAIAPDAEIHSYKAINGGMGTRQRMDTPEQYEAVIAAVDDAVKDGNRVINLSLGFFNHPSDRMVKTIQGHARKGVLFVVSAGNEGPESGMRTPTSAPDAMTIGAIDAQRKITTFSSGGEKWDPERMAYSIKNVFLAPGHNTNSTTKPYYRSSPEQQDFQRMSGTSMAAPHVSGSVGLLLQAVTDFKLFPDPVTASKRIRDSLFQTGEEVPVNELPSGTPPEQRYIIIDPNKAFGRLRGSG